MKANKYAAIAAKVLVVVVLLSVVSGGCGGSSVKVEVGHVSPREIAETVMVAGTLQSSNPTQVIPAVSGSVAQVMVSEGQQVTAGQPLVQLDTSGLQQSVLSAEASLESIQSIAGAFSSISSAASGVSSSINNALTTVDAGVTNLVNLEKLVVPALPEDQRMAALQLIDNSYQAYLARVANRPSLSVGGGGGLIPSTVKSRGLLAVSKILARFTSSSS